MGSPAPTPGNRFELRHVPALDGLRGAAVAGVLAFHGGHLQGGFLGVDLFFVLSGFLITSLLVAEDRRTGGIGLRRFWGRRARRLLPALFGVLGGVALYAMVFASPGELDAIRADAVSTVFYVANWHAIAAGNGYWDLYAAPSPLEHVWSLAIEEQFYLVWPLVVLGVLAVGRRAARGRDDLGQVLLLACAVAGALASTWWMATLHTPGEDPSRVYLGTDTRLTGILSGAALAIVLARWGHVRGRVGRWALEVVAVAAAGFLAWAWSTTSGSDDWLYQGGFLACALAVVALLGSVSHPTAGPLSRVLSVAPLRSLGLISYGLYLWHWPVFITLRREEVANGWTLFALQVGVSLAFALVSYRYLEQPIRQRVVAAWWRPAYTMPTAALACVAAVLLATAGGIQRPTASDPLALSRATSGDAAAALTPLESVAPERSEPDATEATAGSSATVPTTPTPGDGTGAIARPVDRPARVLLVGDSVAALLGDRLALTGSSLEIEVANRGLIGCGVARDSGRIRYEDGTIRQDDPFCATWPTRWADDVATFRPDAALLVVGAPGMGQREVAGRFLDACDPDFVSWYRDEVATAIDVLGAQGATVFVATAPYGDFPFMPDSVDVGTDCLNDAYRAAVEARPAARLVDLNAWLCTDHDHCTSEIDGVVLRPDGLHFEGPGADVAGTWLTDQMFERGP
ncbi:MAG: acyltransferase [Acidimicrobiales bacterium]|nr:acyltransferase [Acidimicrobiales bacterium]